MEKILIDFINRNSDKIDDSNWLDLFAEAWSLVGFGIMTDLLDVLYECEDKNILQLACIMANIKWRINFERVQHVLDDPANSWSRLNWMLDAIPYYDQDYQTIKEAVWKNKDWLGVTLKPLAAKYSWNGSDDYDLGWFKPKYYREEG